MRDASRAYEFVARVYPAPIAVRSQPCACRLPFPFSFAGSSLQRGTGGYPSRTIYNKCHADRRENSATRDTAHDDEKSSDWHGRSTAKSKRRSRPHVAGWSSKGVSY